MGYRHRYAALLLLLLLRLHRELLPPSPAPPSAARGGAACGHLTLGHTPRPALPDADSNSRRRRTCPPTESSPRTPPPPSHLRPPRLPGDAAEPRRPSRLRKRDEARAERAAAQCGRGGDLYGPREGGQLCGRRPHRSVVHRADPRVIGAPVSPAAAARRPPPPTATGLYLKFAYERTCTY